jgi:hypothetical protein
MNPLGVVLLLILLAVLVFIAVRLVRLKKRAETAETWPTIEATVQSGEEFITSGRGGGVRIFCFSFSYLVNGEYHSGRFELLPDVDLPDADAVLSRMKDRKFPVHYDPAKPVAYYIPEKKMEDCDVVQEHS